MMLLLFNVLIRRLERGAGFKVGVVALETVPTANLSSALPHLAPEKVIPASESAEWIKERESYYGDKSKRLGLVHRLYQSRTSQQEYDALIYIIPHGDASLASVQSVGYFFGEYWENKVFVSTDRARGFPIVASAYGPFLCVAKVNFSDGTSKFFHRYIDFEMGDVAPLPAKEQK